MVTDNNKTIRVLVADDHPLMREGIAAVIDSQPDMEVAGEAGDGAEAVRLYRELRPDVALIDLQMPGMNGIEAIEAIRAEFPDAHLAILTTYRGDARLMHAVKAGARAYLLKSALRKELCEAIRALAAGRRFFAPDVAADIAGVVGQDSLSAREVQVLQLLARGYSNRDVGLELNLSEDTIKGYLRTITAKLGANNRTHAVTIGIERGFIDV